MGASSTPSADTHLPDTSCSPIVKTGWESQLQHFSNRRRGNQLSQATDMGYLQAPLTSEVALRPHTRGVDWIAPKRYITGGKKQDDDHIPQPDGRGTIAPPFTVPEMGFSMASAGDGRPFFRRYRHRRIAFSRFASQRRFNQVL